MQELVSVKKHARTTRNTKNRKRNQKDPIELSPDQQELVDIKNSLGLRHQDYAILLGIGLPVFRHTPMVVRLRYRQTS